MSTIYVCDICGTHWSPKKSPVNEQVECPFCKSRKVHTFEIAPDAIAAADGETELAEIREGRDAAAAGLAEAMDIVRKLRAELSPDACYDENIRLRAAMEWLGKAGHFLFNESGDYCAIVLDGGMAQATTALEAVEAARKL